MVLRRVFDFEEGGLVASLKTRVTKIEGRVFRFNTFNTTVLNKPCRKYKIKQQRKFSFVKADDGCQAKQKARKGSLDCWFWFFHSKACQEKILSNSSTLLPK